MRSDEETINEFVIWLRKKFPRLTFLVKKSLKEIFPEPSKYKSFWSHKWAHADISVFRHNQLVCIIEPGGFQHLTDKKQMVRDKKKSFICEENEVSFLPLMNITLKEREKRNFENLLRRNFYKKKID